MTTVEKLLAQIFERKKSIIEQVNQQTELYRQYLASKSLIDGITPPTWLWNPNTSDSEELNKDELISKLICPYPQSSARWSFASYPGYNNLVITGDSEEFCDKVSVENPAFCNRQDDPTVPALSTNDNAECTLNYVRELDSSVASPKDHTDERILNIYHAPDQSLAQIKRSKSRQKALELRSSAKALVKRAFTRENAEDAISSQIRFSLSVTNQEGENDELPQSAKPRAIGGECCEETTLEEADCTTLSATDQAGKNDELNQLAEPCTVADQSCERMNIDQADCTSREQRPENTKDVVSSQIRISLSATDQAGQIDELTQLVAEPRAFSSQCCEEINLEEADYTSRELGEKALELQISAKAANSGLLCENMSDAVSSQVRLSLPAADQEKQNGELPQLKEPCAVGRQSCGEKNLDEADCISSKSRRGTYCDMVTRSRSRADVPVSVKGFLTLGCSSEDCKENDFWHVAKAKRTESMPISHSEHADTCINFSKSVGPSDFCRQSCGDGRVDDACFSIKDQETNVCTGISTKSKVSRKRQSCGSDSSNFDNSCDNYQGMDISTMDSGNNLTPGTHDGSLVKVNLPNVCNEGLDTQTSISEDSRRYKEKDALPSCSSSQQNTSGDTVSDLEASSFSAKVDGGILATSSGVSARQVIGSVESSGLVKSSISEDSRRYKERDALPSCSSSQQNTRGDAVSDLEASSFSAKVDGSIRGDAASDLEASSFSAKVDGSILATSSGVSTRQVIGSVESSGLVKPSISEDSRRYNERDALPSYSSSQQNTRGDAVSDLEASTFSAKVDGGILASSSGVSTRQVTGAVEASGLVKPSVGLFRRLTRSQTWSNDKETYQPVPNSENTSFRSPISKPDTRACLEVKVEVCSQHGDSSLRDNVLGTHTTVRLHGENLSLEGSPRYTTVESWPQVKRRKIECQQANGFTTSPSFWVKKHHSIHGGPVSTYLKSMEINADTAFTELVNERTDARICPEMNSSLKEGNLSQHGKVGSSYKEKNENKTSPSDVNNQKLEASLMSSLPLVESRNSQGCCLEGVITSLSSCDLFDEKMSGNEQCNEHFCDLENSADNLNSEYLKLSNTLLEGIQSPKWGDGLHAQHPVLSPSNEDLELADVDQSIPVFEGFIVDSQTSSGGLNFVADGFHFDELNLPRTTLERASILAEICRSARLDSPSYQFSSDFEFQGTQNIFQSLPNGGNFENLNFRDTFPLSSVGGKHLQSGSSSSDDHKDTIDGMPYSVSLAYSGARCGWNSRNQYPSPVGKLWDRHSSYTGSLSSNPELTCFPIEEDEDPTISEGNKTLDENAGAMQKEINSSLANHCDKRKPLKDLTNLNLSVSAEEEIFNTDTTELVSTKFSVTGTQESAHCVPKGPKYHRNKSEVSENQTGRTNQPSCIGANRIKKAKESVNNGINKSIVSNKISLKGHDQKLSLRRSTRNNIVSNVSSFVPLVQQKQAATACAGKRDVKVKALEAAEAAKRLEEKKENERKLRKEAMKLERAKLEEKNLRHMELAKKRKVEERKKKDADIMAKKRKREEEEKKEKEKKRMRPDVKQRQREIEEKKRAEKAEKERENHRSKDQLSKSKESLDEPKRQQSETSRGDGVALQKEETKLTLTGVVMNHGKCGTSVITSEEKAMHSLDRSPQKKDLIPQTSRVLSYEISPYQCSDDEDEEDDELPTKKRIPSWASKNSVAMFLPLQQKLDPNLIFPLESFCSPDGVLLPRKLLQSQVVT